MYMRGWVGWKFCQVWGSPSTRLSEQVDPGAVLPLWLMYAEIVRWYPGPPDATVCGPHQSDGNVTLYISIRPGVGMPPLFCEADGYPFLGSHQFHTQ